MRKPGILGMLLITLIARTNSLAKEVSMSKAKVVAENFLSEHFNSGSVIRFNKNFIVSKQHLKLYYVFIAENEFVIVSAADAVYPVIAYGKNNVINENSFPPEFQFWMEQYKTQIFKSIKENLKATNKIQKAWNNYSSETFKPDNGFSQVEPLLHTKWSQDCYYNSFFPSDTSGPCNHVWVGCVATAMGQLMKYYNFPKNGSGTHSYNTPYGLLTADFGNTFYDWTSMNYHVTSENNAVAELLFQCAVSVDSQIFPYGTGAWDFDARDAMVEYFSYKNSAQFLWRAIYSGDWKSLLRSELDQHRPVIYGGVDNETNAGHTFICDGYQDTDFFHFNWGWNGSYDGYFYIDSLSAGGNNFNIQHDAIVGLQPDIPDELYLFPPENLTASINTNDVLLLWDAAPYAGTLELLGYNVYRDEILVNLTITAGTEYSDSDVPAGSHQYKVRPVYIGTEPDLFASVDIFVEGNGINNQLAQCFEIYPNPVSDFLIISPKSTDDRITNISILNHAGSEVYESGTEIFADNINTINTSSFVPGIYLLRIYTNKGQFSEKLVITH